MMRIKMNRWQSQVEPQTLIIITGPLDHKVSSHVAVGVSVNLKQKSRSSAVAERPRKASCY